MKVNDKDIKTVLALSNPFMFRMDDGRLCSFVKTEDCYIIAMFSLYNNFPAGFVDVPLFMMSKQNLSPKEANRICPEKQYAYIEWWNLECPKTLYKLRYVFRLLLKVGDFVLNDDFFDRAVRGLQDYIRQHNVNNNKNNLHVLSPI